MKSVIVLHPADNVGTAIADLDAGDAFEHAGVEIRLLEAVPFGHKVALTPIVRDAAILKYGQPIGTATTDIPLGGFVHVHNVDSQRGRGDRSVSGTP